MADDQSERHSAKIRLIIGALLKQSDKDDEEEILQREAFSLRNDLSLLRSSRKRIELFPSLKLKLSDEKNSLTFAKIIRRQKDK